MKLVGVMALSVRSLLDGVYANLRLRSPVAVAAGGSVVYPPPSRPPPPPPFCVMCSAMDVLMLRWPRSTSASGGLLCIVLFLSLLRSLGSFEVVFV